MRGWQFGRPDFVIHSKALSQFPWLMHGFGTRASQGWPPDSGQLATLRQVHSDRILLAAEAGLAGEADALISNRPGLFLAVRTADCYPILIVDPAQRAVAAVHAGWRGTASGIAGKTATRMAEAFGSNPGDLVVAMGPGIGSCCYEVGPEVAERFRPIFPEWNGLPGRIKLDLLEANRRQLLRAGITSANLVWADRCTCCGDGDVFESYRRDQEAAGRMISLIGIAEGGS